MKRISKKNSRKINRYISSAAFLCGTFLMTAGEVSAEETMPPDVTVVSRETTVLYDSHPETTENPSVTDTASADDAVNDEVENADGDNEPKIPSGNGVLVEEGFDETVNRQFLTIQSKNGNTFYIIVDKDSKDRENVYFLNTVDEYDLLAFAEDFPEGADIEFPADTENGAESDNQTVPDEPSEKPVSKPVASTNSNLLIFIVILALIGGAAFYFFKVKGISKPAQKPGLDDDFDYDDEENEDE